MCRCHSWKAAKIPGGLRHGSLDCTAAAPAPEHDEDRAGIVAELTARKQQQGCTGAGPVSSALHAIAQSS